MKRHRQLRQRLRERSLLAGIFYKSAGYHAIEALGSSGLDYLVLDAEHAPFSPDQLDACLLAARAVDLPALVRVPDARTISLQAALDMGAAGVLVPHVSSAAMAREVVAGTRYAGGRRGFSNSTRAGGYGQVSMPTHIADSDRQVAVLCQIEDRAAVEAVDAIAAVDGVDCLFIGRADLAVSYGRDDIDHVDVQAAVQRIAAAGRQAGVPVGIFVGDTRDIERYRELGISLFLVGSDQSLLKGAVTAMVGSVRATRAN